MKKIVCCILFFYVFMTISGQKHFINDPNAEVRKVTGFHAINVSDAIDLQLSQSNEEAVAVTASKDEYRNRIRTVVENGVLRIWYDSGSPWWKNSGNRKLMAYVSFRTLDKLSASGASDINVTGEIKSANLALELSGSSDFRGAVKSESLVIMLTNASDAIISGAVGKLTVEAHGASELKGYNLQTKKCSAKATGASAIQITVNEELNARASGASSIYYKGDGSIRKIKTGTAGSVEKKVVYFPWSVREVGIAFGMFCIFSIS